MMTPFRAVGMGQDQRKSEEGSNAGSRYIPALTGATARLVILA